MITYINGAKVEGTPQEIYEYRRIMNNEKPKAKTLCSCIDWRDMTASPFCQKCGGTGSY